MLDDIKPILLARVYDVAVETPLTEVPKLSARCGVPVYLKREDLQPVHSFKLRGAYNCLVNMPVEARNRGVIAASAGNHAQGVALAARRLGVRATIVMPRTTPTIKVEAVRGHGAEVILIGDSFQDAYQHARELESRTGATFVHPFDDPLVIAGQGTIGREIIEQLPEVTHIYVPVGGGGLIAGIALYVKHLRPEIEIVGVEPADSNVMQVSLAAGKRVTLDHVGIFAEGVAVKQAGERTFAIARRFVDRVITVTTDEICAGIKAVFEDTRSIVEPAGALAAAGVLKEHGRLAGERPVADGGAAGAATATGGAAHSRVATRGDAADATGAATSTDAAPGPRVVAICSGANLTFERLQQVAERTLIGSGREVLVAIAMPEEPGALQRFCAEVLGGHAITEFNYRLSSRRSATILVGVAVADASDRAGFLRHLSDYGYSFTDLSEDDLTKEHVRHMVGGMAPAANAEHLYQINFPERPGALGDFLATVGTRWNISAFHYRNQASDTGNVLIGFEAADRTALEQQLDRTGYDWACVDDSAAMRLFVLPEDGVERR